MFYLTDNLEIKETITAEDRIIEISDHLMTLVEIRYKLQVFAKEQQEKNYDTHY